MTAQHTPRPLVSNSARVSVAVLLLSASLALFGCTATGATRDGLTGAPCTGQADCAGDTCLPVAAGERVCTTDCTGDEQCMPGWTCGGFGGLPGTICLCDAHPEVCDGDDDDCDGLIDEECGAAASACGDGTCDGAEDCASCAEDCGECAGPTCGDGTCDGSESCDSCPGDCGGCAPTCGDGVCDEGEACGSCAEDCGPCCGDAEEEPNDIEAEATRYTRPAPYSCQYTDSFEGVLAGADDDDWISLYSSDTRAGGCDHRLTIDAPGLTTCIYGACAIVGSTPATSCIAGTPAVSPDGVPGCCSSVGPATLQIVCEAGHTQATNYYFHVSGAEADMCVPYRVTYRGSPSAGAPL